MTKVLIIRARGKVRPVSAVGVDVVQIPVIYAAPNEDVIRSVSLASVDYVVVMSSAVIEYVKDKLTSELSGSARIIGVGPVTCNAIRRLGLNCELPREFSSYGVVEYMSGLSRGKVAILRSGRGSDYVRTELGRLGFEVVEYRVYDVAVDPTAVELACKLLGFVDIVVFMSPMTYEAISGCAKKALAGKVVIAIGRTTAMRLAMDGIEALIPSEFTQDGVLKLINRLITSNKG